MVVYIVLGILYESYIHPLTILSGLPSAGFGALVTLIVFRHGSEHLRVRRHDHADRHRREERDHADRLRARSRARRHVAGAGDLSRLPDPLPADHDDDDGGAAGRRADCARLRRRRRSAAAAGPGRRRRADVLAARHALPDAGVLHLHGAAAGLAQGRRRAHAGRDYLQPGSDGYPLRFGPAVDPARVAYLSHVRQPAWHNRIVAGRRIYRKISVSSSSTKGVHC